MAISVDVANLTTATAAAGGNGQFDLTKPSGVSVGDLLIAICTYDSGATSSSVTWSLPSGFAEHAAYSGQSNAAPQIHVFWKIADGTEASTLTFDSTLSAGTINSGYANLFKVSGVDTGTPFDATATSSGTSSTSLTHTNTAITTATANAVVVVVAAWGDGRFLAAADSNQPSGWTVINVDIGSSSSSNTTLGVAYKEFASAGDTGTITWGNVLTTVALHSGITVALRPATSSGLTITSVTPSSFDDGVTGIVIAGSGFGASQGSSTVDIGGQAQTVTAWTDTSITMTSARGSNSMGAGQLKVTIR